MKLSDILLQKRKKIVGRWFDLIIGTYPGLSSIFLRKKHAFGNPVGVNIERAIAGLYDELLKEEPGERLQELVGDVMRIRAVQEFSPAQAAGVFFFLKQALRRELKKEISQDAALVLELLDFESKVDILALLAFDLYVTYREKLYELRVNEVKQRYSGILRRTGFIAEIPGADPCPGPGGGYGVSEGNSGPEEG